MSAAKGMGSMATETDQQDTLDDGIEVVIDGSRDDGIEVVTDASGDDGTEIVLDRGGGIDVEIGREGRGDGNASATVDSIAVVEAETGVHTPTVEVVVVDDAYITAAHADAQQVFAAAARLRPVFAVLSIVMMIGVILAVYGVSVLVTA